VAGSTSTVGRGAGTRRSDIRPRLGNSVGSSISDLRPRVYVVAALLLGFALVIVARLVEIQVMQHSHFATLATEEHWRETPLPARRGDILDVHGNPLATTVDFETLYASTNEISDPTTTATKLAPLLGQPEASLAQQLAKKQTAPIQLAVGLTDTTAKQIDALNLSGLYFQIESRRVYPQGNLAAQLLGVVGVDGNGLSGLELQFNSALAGKAGDVIADRDTSGDAIPYGPHQITQPVDGASVTLTVDRYVQWVAERELTAAMQSNSVAGGSIVVLDPRNGAVLAIAGRPSFTHGPDIYSPNSVALYGIPAIADPEDPGTVFKPFALAAALDSGAVSAGSVFTDTGSFSYAGETVQALGSEPTGPETLGQSLARSGTLAVAWAAMKSGPTAFYAVLNRFGFGQDDHIDLPGATPGALRQPTAPDWFALDLATNAEGRGFQVTTLQLAVAAGAIANGGTGYQPYVVQQVAGPDGHQVFTPKTTGRVISPATAAAVSRALVTAVDDPTSDVHAAAVPGYAIAGAAGTVETPVIGGYNQTQTVATFVGYAPADRPRFVVVLRLAGIKNGSPAPAVSAFNAVARELLTYYQIPPSRTVP